MKKPIVDLGELRPTKKGERFDAPVFLAGFRRFLAYEKNFSSYNVEQTGFVARRIIGVYNVHRPTVEDAYGIREDLEARGRAPSTVRHYLRCLELMAEWQKITVNGEPFRCVMPKAEYKVVRSLSAPESRAIGDSCLTVRDNALVHLALHGLRRGEIVRLLKGDVDLMRRLVYVRKTKNRKERFAVLNRDAAAALEAWMKIRLDIPGVDSLFLTEHGESLTGQRLYRIVKKIARRAGLKDKTTVHVLRHSCATLMARNGISVTEITMQIGDSVTTTERFYIDAKLDDLKEDIDKKFKY